MVALMTFGVARVVGRRNTRGVVPSKVPHFVGVLPGFLYPVVKSQELPEELAELTFEPLLQLGWVPTLTPQRSLNRIVVEVPSPLDT